MMDSTTNGGTVLIDTAGGQYVYGGKNVLQNIHEMYEIRTNRLLRFTEKPNSVDFAFSNFEQ